MSVEYGSLKVPRRYRIQSTSRPAWQPARRPLRPLLFPAALLVVVLSQVIVPGAQSWLPWLVALAFGSFILALNSSALNLVPVLVSELTVYSYLLPAIGMAQRNGIVLLAVALGAPTIIRSRLLSDRRFLYVFLPSIMLVVIATQANSMFSSEEYVLKYLRYQFVQVLVLILFASLIRVRQDLQRLAFVALILGVAGGLAAILQHYAANLAPYGEATAQTIISGTKGRSIGFAADPIALADQMTFVLMPLLGVLLCGPWKVDRSRALLAGTAFVVVAGLNFSYTRSGMFGVGFGLIAMGLFLRGYRRTLLLGLIGLAALVFPLLENTGLVGDRYFEDASEDQSAASHDALWDVGTAIALDNWLIGIGHEHFEDEVFNYLDAVQSDIETVTADDALNQRPHNDFLSVWLSWGIFALVAYAGIFVGTLRNCAIAARSQDWLIRGLAIGCIGGVVVYGVSSAYHNYLDSSMFLWLYAGLSVALVRLSATQQQSMPHGLPVPVVSGYRPAISPATE